MSLASYIKGQHGKRFELGKHDCFTFTNGAWAAMYGTGYADDIMGQYTALGRKGIGQMLLSRYGHADIRECFDAHLNRVTHQPPRGAVVSCSRIGRWITGTALGVAVGVRAAFVADVGVIYLPISDIDGAWVR